MPRRVATDDDWEDDSEGEYVPDDDEEYVPEEEDSQPLIECPHCREQIHEQSEQCPHCGMYVSEEDQPASRKPWWIILGCAPRAVRGVLGSAVESCRTGGLT